MAVAEIVLTGAELVTGKVADVNGPFLADRLTRMGVAVARITLVDDGPEAIAEAVREALERARLVLVSGGLGPTGDDRTRQALADAAGRPLVAAPALPGHHPWPVPEGAVPLENPQGSAAGIWLDLEDASLAALPGVPWELEAMWPGLAERVASLFDRLPQRHGLTLRTVGLTEREVERRVAGPLAALGLAGLEHGVTANPLAVDLHLSAPDPTALTNGADTARATLGDTVYGEGEQTLAGVVGTVLRRSGRRVATAESCTGGALCAALTAVPGASDYVDMAVVSYSNTAKSAALGVPEGLIEAHGAVSDPVARAMAEGLLARARADVVLSVTGIAGPTGGTDEKPVGLVYLAVVDANGTFCRPFHHAGDRARFVTRTVNRGLDLIRRWALGGLKGLEQAFPEA